MNPQTIPRGRAALISVTVVLSTILQTLDSTIANVALPHMQGALSAAQDQISWVVTSYVVASAIGLSLTSYLAQRYGRKEVFTASILLFTAASVLCGAAQSLPEIVLFRLIQGIGGAGLVPLAQAVMMDTYPREKQGQAMAIWGMGVMVGPIVGPTLGGYLTEYYNWRWVFLINLPLGILAALGTATLLPREERKPGTYFDMIGFGFLAVGIGALQLMLDRGQTLDWFESGEIVIEAIVAALCLYLFVVHILTAARPFISSTPFKDGNYLCGLVLMFLMGAVPMATMVLIPTMLQSLMGYPVMDTGWIMAPRGLGTMVAMAVMGRVVQRLDPRMLILAGIGLGCASLWQMASFTLDVSPLAIGVSGFVQGVSMGMLFVPMSSLAFGTLERRFVTEAAALYHLTRNIGNSIGISIVVAMLARNTQTYRSVLVENINLYSHAAQDFAGRALTELTPSALAFMDREITRQASMTAYVDDFVMMCWLTAITAPIVFLLRRPPKVAAPDAQAYEA